MKYQNGADWVVFRPGVARKTIAQVVALSNNTTQLAAQIETCHFENDAGVWDGPEDRETVREKLSKSAPDNPKGEPVDIEAQVDAIIGTSLYEGITFQQFDWLGKQVISWARDEALDPEA